MICSPQGLSRCRRPIADLFQVTARSIGTAIALRHDGDVAIRDSRSGDEGCGFDDHASADILHARRIREFHVMDPTVDAINDQTDSLVHLVTRQPLGQNPAGDRHGKLAAMGGALARPTLLGEAAIGERISLDQAKPSSARLKP